MCGSRCGCETVTRDLGYGHADDPRPLPEEVSRPLNRYDL
jgi:hypothetical protein